MTHFPDLLGLLEAAHHTPALNSAAELVKASRDELTEDDLRELRRAYRAAAARIREYDKEPGVLTDDELFGAKTLEQEAALRRLRNLQPGDGK